LASYGNPVPLVSVIIPTYNRAHVLTRAVKSVLNETFRDFELIVVNDGSTDSTLAVLEKFDHKLRVVSQPNGGVSAARNTGIARAQGELLAFLDSDDEWMPDKLARQTAMIDPSKPFFICHTDELWLREGKQVPQKGIHRKQGGWFFERALERCLISPSSVMISRSLLDEVGMFDENLCAAEDYDLWLRITAFLPVDFVPEPLVVKHGDSPDQLSRTIPAIDRFRIAAIRKIIADPRLRPRYRRAAVQELIKKCAIVAVGAVKRGKTQEAEEYLELARSYENLPPEPARG
jgi:glycosyltransferase involved in cell wall biosynthesis